MIAINALYFPDSLPPVPATKALAAFATPLRCYRLDSGPPSQPRAPTTDHAAWQSLPTPWQELVQAGQLVFSQPPVADPEELKRLQKLLTELEERDGQEAAIFVQGIIRQFGQPAAEQASDLVLPLLGHHDDPAARADRESLWRALLLLKLAELQERRETELVAELQAFEQQRAAVFRQLRGEETSPGAATPPPESRPAPPPRTERNSAALLKAWGEIYLRVHPASTATALELPVSADGDAVALLLDHAETLSGRQTVKLGRLPLPAGGQPALNNVARQELASALGRAAAGDHQAVATALSEWQPQLAAGNEAIAYHLEFFLLPQTPLSAILAHRCQEPDTAPKKGHGEAPHGLLALLAAA
ncbi:MAG: hypothetical protein U5J62_12000 [Desulfurivibrio sp.]|nr:hypothetical protein [Desulfurivibrio sp.]